MNPTLHQAVNRLAKWRAVFAGWQLGTRAAADPECQAVRDHREATLLLRAEVSALVGLLVERGVISAAAWEAAWEAEARRLDRDLERRFPGYRTTDEGLSIDPAVVARTSKGWPP